MRVLSWIFQPVYLIFFAIIAALYIFRAEIIPEHRDMEQSNVLLSRVEQVVSVIKDEHRASDLAIATEPATDVQQQDEVAPALHDVVDALPMLEKQVAQPEPVVNSEPQLVPQSQAGDGDAAVLVTDIVAVVVDAMPTEEPVLPLEVEPVPSLGTLWYAARKSVMAGDIDQAILDYIQLTSSYPQHADGFGELGNLYYMQGNRERALTAYQQTLFIYQSLGYSGESLQLQRVIAELGEADN
jgi:tetratricopeptide (TPR) repeat protein